VGNISKGSNKIVNNRKTQIVHDNELRNLCRSTKEARFKSAMHVECVGTEMKAIYENSSKLNKCGRSCSKLAGVD
jgi:hypothetical protein